MPVGFDARAYLAQAAVAPLGLHACAVNHITQRMASSLRTSVHTAVSGEHRRLRSKEIVLNLFVAGHRVDPKQVIPYTRLTTLKRMLQRGSVAVSELSNVWRGTELRRHQSRGPIGHARKALVSLGWS